MRASENIWYCWKKVLRKKKHLGTHWPTYIAIIGFIKKKKNRKEQGCQNEDVALVTGHKNLNSVQHVVMIASRTGSSTTVSWKVVPIGKSVKIIRNEENKRSDVDLLLSYQTSITFLGQKTVTLLTWINLSITSTLASFTSDTFLTAQHLKEKEY